MATINWPVLAVGLAAVLGPGCTAVPLHQQRIVSKANMQFSDSAVFGYPARLLPQTEPGTALTGGRLGHDLHDMPLNPLPWGVGLGALAGVILALALPARIEAAPAPEFQLPRWQTGAPVRLGDFAGQIVVLDFFAYWCGPCREASASLEKDVQQYYERRGGNARGAVVRVISVNIEADEPEKTGAFIRATGASFVVNDEKGRVLEQFGATAVPFIVVLDGTGGTSAAPRFEVVHRSPGFEGPRAVRAVIDRLGKGDGPSGVEAGAGAGGRMGPRAQHRFELDGEGQWSSDIQLTEFAADYKLELGPTTFRATYTQANFDEDYQPDPVTDPLGQAVNLEEARRGVQLAWRQRFAGRFTWIGAGGGYRGFQDYRSLWLSEYYRQRFGGAPAYRAPDPKGANVGTGLRWEYTPTTGFFQADFGYFKDRVAPGWDVVEVPDPPFFVLVSGQETLKTAAGRVTLENVWTPRLRTLAEFTVSETTGRDARYQGQAVGSLALTEHLVFRPSASYAREGPRFEAYSLGAALEYDWDNRWFVGLFGRYYHDTGYIENSLLISDAAPPLETYQFGLLLRWQGRWAAFRVGAGPYFSRYGAVDEGTAPFRNLYRDRDWWQVQAALSFQL